MILFALACTVVDGNGDITTQPRDVSEFDAIHVSSNVDVDWTQADTTSVAVTCDDNLLEAIATEVVDGALEVRTPDDVIIRPSGECVARVAAPCVNELHVSGSGDVRHSGSACGLASVHVSGSGDVSLDGVISESLGFHISGSGDVRAQALDVGHLETHQSGSGDLSLGGTCVDADVHGSGSGDLSGQDATCESAVIDLSGSGDVTLTVTGHSDVETSGSGDVDLFGGGTVSADSSGSGSVTSH